MKRVSFAVSMFFLLICDGVVAQDARENFKFAKFKYDNSDYNESLKFLNLALAQDSQYVSAYYLRSEVNYQMGQYYNAILDINNIFRIEKDASTSDGSYFLARAKSFLGLKDYSNASLDIDKALLLSYDKSECYYYRAKLYIAIHDYISAIKDLDAAIKLNQQNASYLLLRAETKFHHLKPLQGSDAYKQILEDYNDAIAMEPKNPQNYMARSNFLNEMGETDKALNDYNMVIEMSPKKEEAYAKRGVIKMNNYDFRGATLDFTRSILISPNDESNYRYRGLCYNNLSNYKEAFKDFSKSIELISKQIDMKADKETMKSTLAETYLLRGHCLNLMGNNAQACRDFLMAHNLGVKKGLNYYRKYCGIY